MQRPALLVMVVGVMGGLAVAQQRDDTAAAAKAVRDWQIERAEQLALAGDATALGEAVKLLRAVVLADARADLASLTAEESHQIRRRWHEIGRQWLSHPQRQSEAVREMAPPLLFDRPLEPLYLQALLELDLDSIPREWAEKIVVAQQRLIAGEPAGAWDLLHPISERLDRTPRDRMATQMAVFVLLQHTARAWAVAEMATAIRERQAGDPAAALNRLVVVRRETTAAGAAESSAFVDGFMADLMRELGVETGDDVPSWAVPLDPFSAGFVPLGRNAHGYREFRRPRDGMVMIAVPASTFTMGSDWQRFGDDARPAHPHRLSGFLIDKTEITNAMFCRFLAAMDGRSRDAAGVRWVREHPYGVARRNGVWQPAGPPNAPVVGVTWYGARAYANWVGTDLPTEAQWERAARGTDARLFPWGDDGPTAHDDRAAHALTTLGVPVPVGAFPLGASAVGALDMAGNVWEWCRDAYDFRAYSAGDSRPADGVVSSGPNRVMRGGSCRSEGDDLASVRRQYESPAAALGNVGFRCAFDASFPPVPTALPELPEKWPPARVAEFTPTPEPEPAVAELALQVPSWAADLLISAGRNAEGVAVFERTTDGARVVRIPAGRFQVGDITGLGPEDERPARWMWLAEYFLDESEITTAQFAAFLNFSEFTRDHAAEFIGLSHPYAPIGYDAAAQRFVPMIGREQVPVTFVTFAGACAYSLWAWGENPTAYAVDACLPTAAQWERAAAWDTAAGRKWPLPWGERLPPIPSRSTSLRPAMANFARPTDGLSVLTIPLLAVDSADAKRDRSPCGVLQMAGNVREWTVNAYRPRPYSHLLPTSAEWQPATHMTNVAEIPDPLNAAPLLPRQPGPTADSAGDADDHLQHHQHLSIRREVRGGSWRTEAVVDLRTTRRQGVVATTAADDLGFRTARPTGVGPATDPALIAPGSPSSPTPPARSAAEADFVPATLALMDARTPQGFRQFRRETDGAVMVEIPAGTVRMGGGDAADGLPMHDVSLTAYLIDKTEITTAQFARFLTEYGSLTVKGGPFADRPLIFLDEDSPIVPEPRPTATAVSYVARPGTEQLPVVHVTWFGAAEYARWAGVVLPSEAQWEMAARGPLRGDDAAGGPYPWGAAAPSDGRAVYGRRGREAAPRAVGGRPEGASPFGVLDMAGNVWEWVRDWYDAGFYADTDRATAVDAVNGYPSGRRVNRGGGFRSSADRLQVFARASDSPEVAYDSLGFRCAAPAHFAPGHPHVPTPSDPQ